MKSASLALTLVASVLLAAIPRGSGAADAAEFPSDHALSSDGVWVPVSTPSRSGHTLVHDPARDRLILFGGVDPVLRNDLWWMPGDGSSAWGPMLATGGGPTRSGHSTALFDVPRDRMLVFGGDSSSAVSDQLWSLGFDGLPAWQQLAPAGTPPAARSMHTAVHDPLRDRWIVFGGRDGSAALDDVWALSLSGTPTWSPIATSGTPPVARYLHSTVYDAARDRLVVHGGVDDALNTLDDVWELTLSGTPTWSPIVPLGGPIDPVEGHAAFYDPIHDAMVVFRSGSFFRELLFTPVPTWVEHLGPDSAYLGHDRLAHCADAGRQRQILMGGRHGVANRSNETWAVDWLDLSWSRVGPDVVRGHYWHTLIHDPANAQLVLYGGVSDGVGDGPGEVWTLPLEGARTWSQAVPPGSGPGLVFHTAIHAPSRGSMIVLGATSPPGGGSTALWELELDGTPSWSEISIAGAAPSPRSFHSAVYDAARDRMVVFGGTTASGLTNEVWVLSLAGSPAWTQILSAGTPPSSRSDHSAIYDPIGDRMIVFGGRTGPSTITNEVWSLAFDPAPTWTQLLPSGTPPAASEGSSAAYDPYRKRMFVYGNQANASAVRALALDGPLAWTQLLPANRSPTGRGQSAIAFDVAGDRLAIFGGARHSSIEPEHLNDTWLLTFAEPLAVPLPFPAARARLDAAAPNPASFAARLSFALPEATTGSLAILDLQGRHVLTLKSGALAAGRHEARWDLADARGSRVPAGIYFATLRAGAERVTRKLIVVD